MRLNIGSSVPRGKYRHAPWINIDMIQGKGSRFVRGNGAETPFADGTFEEIHCVHMMEHMDRKFHLPLLTEMYRVLEPGGVALVEVPDFIATCELITGFYRKAEAATGPERERLLERARIFTVSVYGKGRTPWDIHRWGFSRLSMAKLVEGIGFRCETQEEMISTHWKQEPVILFRLIKE